jgi:hypothetical protein
MERIILERNGLIVENYELLTERKQQLIECVLLESYFKQVLIVEGVGSFIKKMVKQVTNLFKSPEKNIDKLKTTKKVIDPLVSKSIKQGKDKEIVDELKQKYQELGSVENESKDSALIMKVIKFLLFGPAILVGILGRLFSPIHWLVLYIIKKNAIKEQISLWEAFKRTARFDISIITKKWSPKFLLMFWSVIFLNIILGPSIVLAPLVSLYTIYFVLAQYVSAVRGKDVSQFGEKN